MKSIHDVEKKNILKMAAEASDRAYIPDIRTDLVKIGVCLKGASGAYYLGATVGNSKNVNVCTCAEHAALCRAVYEGERAFDALAIYSAGNTIYTPCSTCIDALYEFCDDELPIVCGRKNGESAVYALGDIKKGVC